MSNEKVEIVLDEAPVNPYEDWDFLGTIVTWHKRYDMGEQPKGITMHDYRDEVIGDAVNCPIYMRGDDSITTEGGRLHVGYIYVTPERLDDEKLSDKTDDDIKKTLAAEVKVYNHYHMGNVWGAVIRNVCECCDQVTDVKDSCWGFYGDELEETGISGYIDEVAPELKDQLEEAWENRI